jgi:deoxycytidylate deaminase
MPIKYPYLPPDRELKYATHDDPFMIEASRARDVLSGDPSYPVGIVMVKDGEIVARAGNGFNRGKQIHVCPRIVLESPTGTGYELCDLHNAPGHAEQQAIAEARRLGIDPAGCDLYLYGHWWACEPCWNAMIAAGIRDVYLVDDAHERFSRDKVYAQMMVPSFKSVSFEGIEGEVMESVMEYLRGFGIERVEGNADVRCVMGAYGVEIYSRGVSAPVYVVEKSEQIARQIKNVMKQL